MQSRQMLNTKINFITGILNFSLLIMLLASCNKKSSFEEFDFSYRCETTDFSIKFTQSDTVFIKQNFDINDSIDATDSNTNYFAVLNETDRKKFDDLLSDLDFKKYDAEYCQHYKDGREYQLYIKNKYGENNIYVHSTEAPKELDALAEWIYSVKTKLSLTKTDRNLSFISVIIQAPPPPPPPAHVILYKGKEYVLTESERARFLDSLNIKDTIIGHIL